MKDALAAAGVAAAIVAYFGGDAVLIGVGVIHGLIEGTAWGCGVLIAAAIIWMFPICYALLTR